MANETTFRVTFSSSKNGVTVSAAADKTVDLAGTVMFSNVQNIGTTTEQLDLGESTPTIGYLFLKNLDATNYVEFGLNTPLTQKYVKLKPGEFQLVPVATSTIYGLANTGACDVQVIAVGPNV